MTNLSFTQSREAWNKAVVGQTYEFPFRGEWFTGKLIRKEVNHKNPFSVDLEFEVME